MSSTEVKLAIDKLVLAALDLLDQTLSDEQRQKAEEVYDLANQLEVALEDETCTASVQIAGDVGERAEDDT
jgi:hypothetical protein